MRDFLREFARFIAGQPFSVMRVSEAREDEPIETLELQKGNACQNVYSVAKAFTMTAVGLLRDRGLMRLDEKLCGILEDELPEGMDARWRESTVETALLHRLGLPAGFLDIDTTPSSRFGRDYLRYTLTWPLAYPPGTESRYSDGAYYLLARAVEKKAGLPMDNFLWRELMYPLGFQEMAWSRCPMGHPMGATGLYIHSADMVKLGLVYLCGGLYEGKRILSEEWTRLAPAMGYGLEGDVSLYGKGGMYGQKLYVDMRNRRAVAVQSYGADMEILDGFVRSYGPGR